MGFADAGRRSLAATRRRLGRVPTAWSVGLVRGGSIHDLVVSEPVLSPGFKPVQHLSLAADPFFMAADGCVYLYFEGVVGANGRGEIHLAVLESDGVEYLGPSVVEDIHVSFPYVFRDATNKRYCMIPETSEGLEVRLYVSQHPAGPWALERVLLRGRPFVDTVAFHRDGAWYLVCESSGGRNNHREVHRADSLESEFTLVAEHQLNPARCRLAGRVVDVTTSGAPSRSVRLLTQDCAETYGRSVSIESIGPWLGGGEAPREFLGESEHLIGASQSRWYHARVHGLDLRVGSDQVVGVIDGRGRITKHSAPPRGEIASFIAAATRIAGMDLP